MDVHERLLSRFLAGDLDRAATRQWDEHLLDCEQCWRAVREDRAGRQAAELLRRPVPAGLADRVRFAVELAAASGAPSRRGPRGLAHWHWAAGAGALAAGLAVALVVFLLPGGRGSVSPAVAAVARYAEEVPPQGSQLGTVPGPGVRPVEVGRPVRVMAGGQPIVMRIWRLGRFEAVVAVSTRPFLMPPGGQGRAGGGMAWSARLGKLGLYCINGGRSELVAAAMPAAELARLAVRLPPA